MAFSGALTLTDLNDFITPSQACIKPVEQPSVQKKERGAASTEIVIDSSGEYYEVSSEARSQKLHQAQISLNDCLACSGCITSAESVLITLQSHREVLNFLSGNALSAEPKIVVLSIAPQSLASLAASVGGRVTPRQILRRVEAFCKEELGIEQVFDTTFARELALREHVKEYLERKRGDGPLPMLASACPGWICYAEKTHGEILPFIARTKSPQQVMGTVVKRWMGASWGRRPDGVYHVTVMPCYDKKLEATRKDFYDEEYETREVDCVITTGELEVMMGEKGWDLSREVDGEGEERRGKVPDLVQHAGSSSGSYLQSIIKEMGGTEVIVKKMRNADYEEYTVMDTGKVVFKGAKCYGFRNLQNMVRKVGKGRTEYDYVEVMACPGGCVNGGGQLKRGRGETGAVEGAYWAGTGDSVSEALVGEVMEAVGRAGMRTEYRAVEKEVVGLGVEW